mmetsp:Transcript_14410/g.20568  ORF Transcript_14410/g.20568 Transcript_14410/m.20568 type:complete len:127 (-) Transcript_14410:155-535(-)|eukprot:CAMPEP_0184855028 /NCGR_PEP_ID=MMETSP0580-20130426/374_1 /TAXON_ID=1118495 /ORGANISM="Dactyliosolen fragilissimus" /LENGTH=126 /DNA_ID=CAMNT_0027349439 /DNA_START=172 /DNA_END=552 /DNA_ORIENTATION=+
MPFSEPKFTVVNPSPTVDDCVKSMRIRDYSVIGGITAGSWSYGYIFGKPARMPTASTAAALGFTFAGFLILQDTRKRLMGYAENTKEVKLYGAFPEQPSKFVQKDARFPVAITTDPKSYPKYDNYN